MFDSFKGFVGDTVQGLKSGIETIGQARYKDGEPMSESDKNVLLENIRATKFDKKKRDAEAADITLTPELEASFYRDAEEEALSDIQNLESQQLTLFGELTKPKSLLTGLGIVASLMAGRQSQRAYDDYMKGRQYDPSQNPFMANGGGIQAFADGNKVEPIGQQKLSDMMIMNLREKPTSAMIKLMTVIDSPEILSALLGMNKGGGIQGFAKGSPEFPRMTGNIEGPGTGTSDSIPAMLSDGEHVLTKQEVSQIGGGNNDLGHQRLYSMRQDLRSQARSNGIGRM